MQTSPDSPPRERPPLPHDIESARLWRAFARDHHQDGCHCHGCIAMRELLRDHLDENDNF